MVRATVYAVVYNIPGCLPDDPDSCGYFASEQDAESYVLDQETAYNEENEEPDCYVWDIIPVDVWRDGDGLYYERVGLDYVALDVV